MYLTSVYVKICVRDCFYVFGHVKSIFGHSWFTVREISWFLFTFVLNGFLRFCVLFQIVNASRFRSENLGNLPYKLWNSHSKNIFYYFCFLKAWRALPLNHSKLSPKILLHWILNFRFINLIHSQGKTNIYILYITTFIQLHKLYLIILSIVIYMLNEKTE